MAEKQKPRGKYALKDADKPKLKLARERWKFSDESEGKQAERELADLGFYAGDPKEQWGAAALAMRSGQAATQGGQGAIGMPATPERPTLVVNKVLEPVRQVQNEIRAADIGVELVPADDFGDLGVTPDDTEVTLREGLIRRIQRESEAEAARNWAGDRAIIAGRGYYQVATRYLPGKTHNQEVYIHGIYNQAGVKLDPSHEQPDGSDADWGFVGTWMPWDRFATTYPTLADDTDNPFAECSEEDFIGMSETYPDWFQAAQPADPKKNATAKQTAVRIVDYWYTERNPRELWTLTDGTDVWADEVAEEAIPKEAIAQKRTVIEKSIKFCKIAGGVMILEETDWPSPEFPIIKVLGEQLQPYDDERRAIGMVRPARGAQQGFNYMLSKLVETVGLTPIPPIIVDPDAIDGYEEWWKQAATRAFYMLPQRTRDDQGNEFREAHRPNVDPNLQPMSLSIGMFDQLIKSTTAVPDPTLGNVDPSLKSGKAIDRVVANAKNSTSNFLDNRVIATKREGTIVNSLLYPIYGQPGRIVQIMTGESQRQKMQIGDPQAAQQAQAIQAQAIKVGTLTKDANFNVIVKVTKNEESRRQQEAQALGELISADPQLMGVYGDLYFLNSDIPGRVSLAKRAKVMLAPPVQAALAEEEGKGPTPQMLMQKLSQAQEQIKHAEMAMQELADEAKGKKLDYQKAIDTAQIKARSDAELARIDADRQIKLQAMKDAATIEAARIAAEAKVGVSQMEAREEAVALGLTQAHDAATTAIAQAHERDLASSQMAHEAATQGMQQDHDAEQAQLAQQNQPEQAGA